MDWKYEAIDKLKGYTAKQQALVNIPDELERLQGAFTGIRSVQTDATPVDGGGSTREDALLSNIVHRQELEARLEDAKLWVKTVDRALGVLDADELLVLDMMYINRGKGNVGRLCERLGVEQSTVFRRRDKALHHFTVALYGTVWSI